jgi:hypothetical protein
MGDCIVKWHTFSFEKILSHPNYHKHSFKCIRNLPFVPYLQHFIPQTLAISDTELSAMTKEEKETALLPQDTEPSLHIVHLVSFWANN